jgi:large subunit ribosomal protein L23
MSALFKKTKETKKASPAVVADTPATPAEVKPTKSLIKRVYVSEKASRIKEFNQYVFEVTANANRPEIKKEIQKKYNVHITKINILNRVPKKVTVGRYEGTRSGLRKAIITLKKGEVIPEA